MQKKGDLTQEKVFHNFEVLAEKDISCGGKQLVCEGGAGQFVRELEFRNDGLLVDRVTLLPKNRRESAYQGASSPNKGPIEFWVELSKESTKKYRALGKQLLKNNSSDK